MLHNFKYNGNWTSTPLVCSFSYEEGTVSGKHVFVAQRVFVGNASARYRNHKKNVAQFSKTSWISSAVMVTTEYCKNTKLQVQRWAEKWVKHKIMFFLNDVWYTLHTNVGSQITDGGGMRIHTKFVKFPLCGHMMQSMYTESHSSVCWRNRCRSS
jgi:hypothetical protein